MYYLKKFVNSSGKGGMVVGSVFLAAAMIIMVANIIIRFFGGVIPGTYEMIGLFVGITVSFCLPFTALAKRHVTVNFFTSRFPPRVQDIFKGITTLIELIFWAIVAWMTLEVINERRLNEATMDLELPMLPFRIFWFIGLIIFCAVLLQNVIDAFRGEVKE